ncbi:MAG TPA: cell division protein FtsK [Candidatus Magasanikbacteria bacterium]|nr:cell division protein FtsK [Candidatus Magasanikbacteria bacterium]
MGRRGRGRQSNLDPVLSRGILAIVVAIAAIIFGLSFFGKAGAVGIMLDEYVLSFLFGSIRYTVPFVMLVLAWYLVRDTEYNYHPTHGIGAVLFFLSLASFMHIKFEPSEMWTMALDGFGGGIFGMLAWPLKMYLGTIAGKVILIGMVAVGFFLIFNTSFAHFVLINKKIFAGLGWVGKSILKLFGLFVEKNKKHLQVNGDYDEDSEDVDDLVDGEETEVEEETIDEDEDLNTKKVFAKKIIGSTDDNSSDENNSSEDAKSEEDGVAAWQRNVVIKNLPNYDLLNSKRSKPTSGDIKANAQTIHDTFQEFNIGVEMGEVRVGPTVTQYSLKPDKGIKLTRITTLSNDLSLALAAHPIRIEAPIPGKSLVGIEVPNFKAAMVTLKELLESKEFVTREHNLMIALGKDVSGKVWFADLPRMPHLLVAGATGSGKTVCINTIIMSLLYQNTAETLRLIMVDPKRVELTPYNGIPHLLTPVITNVHKTVNALKWCIGEMDRRFELFSKSHSRDIGSYNSKHPNEKIPHIVFVIDELADLMASAASEVEAGIIRIAQMARAVGIHLIVATQRPSVDIITGLMKANIPARIAFSVASIIDSRTILDCPGADKLLGRGDMLYLTAELSKPVRIQGAFVSEQEVHNVADYLKGDGKVEYDESIVEKPSSGTMNMFGGSSDDQDPLFEESRQAIIQVGKASASFLQRRLKIGYARAARILDELEAAGIIGPGDGAKPREILTTEAEIEDSDMGMGQKFNVFGGSEETVEENNNDKVEEEIIEETEAVVEEENNPDEEILEDNIESEEEVEEEKY